jgi:hypothetical protein
MKKHSFILLFLFSLLLIGCGSGGSSDEPESTLQSIEIVNIETTYIVGVQFRASLQGTYSDGQTTILTGVTWSSSSSSVATINAVGDIVAVTEGTTTITASAGELSTDVDISIVPATLVNIEIISDSQELPLGASLQLTARGNYDNGLSETLDEVQWSVSDSSIATIASSGNVTPVDVGVIEVTVQTESLSNSMTLTIIPALLVSINVQIIDDDIAEGTTTQGQALGTFSDNTTIPIDVDWQTSNDTIATIDDAGLITGVSFGETQISAVSGTLTSNAVGITIFDIKFINIDVVGDYRDHVISYADIYDRYIEINDTYNLDDLQIEFAGATANSSDVSLDPVNNQLIYRPMSGYWGDDDFTITLWNGSFQDEIGVVVNIQRDYILNVSGSSHGVARYLPTTNVSITADLAPDGQRFEFWQAIDSEQPIAELVDDAESETAILTMPSFDLRLNAIYQTAGTTDTESPTAPGNFRAESIGNTIVVFAWEASTDNVAVVNYQVTELTSDITLTTESTSITFGNLIPDTLYTFQIRAFDAAGNQSTLVFSEPITTTNNIEELRTYHFGHSLMLHDVSNNPIYDSNSGGSRDDKELSILHWMKQLTDASGGIYFADGQYRNQARVGYAIPADNGWFEPETSIWSGNFVDSGYNAVLYTDINFLQYIPIGEPSQNDSLTPIEMFERIINYDELEPNTPIYLYASWPDAGGALDGVGYAEGISPPTLQPNAAQVSAYYRSAIGEGENIPSYEQWWRDLYQETRSTGNVIYMPVNWILIRTIRDSGYLNNAQFGDLFEDNAPHGRASVYLMAAMIQYVVMNNAVPAEPQNLPAEVIHGDIISNFDAIASFMLSEWQIVKADLSIEQ